MKWESNSPNLYYSHKYKPLYISSALSTRLSSSNINSLPSYNENLLREVKDKWDVSHDGSNSEILIYRQYKKKKLVFEPHHKLVLFSIVVCSSKYDICQILIKNENAMFYYCLSDASRYI